MGTLWFNGTFFTMRKENEAVEAVYVNKGKIIQIGSTNKLESIFKNEISKRINLYGAYVYPGFVDSHLHMISHGEKLSSLDLSNVTTIEEMKQKILQEVQETKPNDWIIGEGWNENQLPDRKILHRLELDALSPHHPLILKRVCRHALLANSIALKIGKIDDILKDPPGGIIVRDESGVPNGYLLDAAQEFVLQNVPQVSEFYLEKALMKATDHMLSLGLVGGHTEDLNYYGGFLRTFQTFQKVIDGENRKFRAHLLVHHDVIDDMHHLGFTRGFTTPYIELGSMKIFADGALGGRTALLSNPYHDQPDSNGVAIHQPQELKKLVKQARSYNMPVAIHTIGDLAIEYAIEAIEESPPPIGLRDRLIHVQVLREDLLERLKKLSIVLDIQPRFVASDFPWVSERLGKERLKLSFAWKTLLHNNLFCAGGSDAPIEPVNPLLGIHAAVTRRKLDESHEGYLPKQKLTRFEAVQLFTIGSARAIGKESTQGMILPGYVADFTVLDKNLFYCEEDEIPEVNVLKTVVDNTIMYEK